MSCCIEFKERWLLRAPVLWNISVIYLKFCLNHPVMLLFLSPSSISSGELLECIIIIDRQQRCLIIMLRTKGTGDSRAADFPLITWGEAAQGLQDLLCVIVR